ncbi:BgTH12-02702 [Blumeria graminis f. sp. triticale]|uniref:BgTH12-02702 n=1 Tax=Blumeria graminis f. sp. triticale TaxID=1689686 RepID=A0A9W4GFN4_BLUGR|nr:BgTH12-02702 [Blumeria graminis f. sp. triticale]
MRILRTIKNTRYQSDLRNKKLYFALVIHRYQHVSTRITQTRSQVNGPLSTLPTSLDLPTRKTDQNIIYHLFSIGKAYLHFYKSGMKNIYYNYKASQPIKELIDSKYGGSVEAAATANAITRHDFLLVMRNWHDIQRVPAFGLMFVIFGEFTPLVVMAISGIVPWTCRVPAQIKNDRMKLEQMRQRAFRQLANISSDKLTSSIGNRRKLSHISKSLGLSSQLWDWIGGTPSAILQRKVSKKLEHLKLDDNLIVVAGGVEEMSVEEVEMALVDRGIDTIGKNEIQLKHDLNLWLQMRKNVPMERLLLVRPSDWPVVTAPT